MQIKVLIGITPSNIKMLNLPENRDLFLELQFNNDQVNLRVDWICTSRLLIIDSEFGINISQLKEDQLLILIVYVESHDPILIFQSKLADDPTLSLKTAKNNDCKPLKKVGTKILLKQSCPQKHLIKSQRAQAHI